MTQTVKIEVRKGVDGRTYFCVIVASPVASSGWIVQGEHLTRAAAEQDAMNWQ